VLVWKYPTIPTNVLKVVEIIDRIEVSIDAKRILKKKTLLVLQEQLKASDV
jgi:hypothetical protein